MQVRPCTKSCEPEARGRATSKNTEAQLQRNKSLASRVAPTWCSNSVKAVLGAISPATSNSLQMESPISCILSPCCSEKEASHLPHCEEDHDKASQGSVASFATASSLAGDVGKHGVQTKLMVDETSNCSNPVAPTSKKGKAVRTR